ncbi:MAG: redox-regulated ATPase YchF [archaeon]
MLIGIVGKPNVGKTTFFKALTLMDAQAANYPFTTIDPNKGVSFVRNNCIDSFFNVQCNPRSGYCKNHIRYIPVDIIDVAGLVPGASEGRGLGNKFLTDLNKADCLIQVIDISGSTDEEGKNVARGSYNPSEEIKFLLNEIEQWLLGIFKKNFEKLAREQKMRKIKTLNCLMQFMAGLGINEESLDIVLKKLNLQEKYIIDWSEEELLAFTKIIRENSKPIIIAANKIDIPGAKEILEKVKKDFPDLIIIPCSAESEFALKSASKNEIIDYLPGSKDFTILKQDLPDKQKLALNFIKSEILEKYEQGSGVQKVLDIAVFDILKYICVYPGGTKGLADKDGNILPDCFLMPKESKAIDFAFKLHSDFGNNFIKAIDVKTKMLLGKDHPLKNNDVIEIVSGK